MRIVNPLYDRAFKYLMDNKPLAKKILEVVIEQKIETLDSQPQETIVYTEDKQPVSRFDFKAIILTESGERYATLIEVQKSRSPNPVPRFRRYLGTNYMKEHEYIDENGIEQKSHLPIISIYFLGYKLGKGQYDTPGIVVNNNVIDAVSKESINTKHKFIRLLSHPCYILQAERLRPERKTKLEKMLSLFDQTYCTDDKYLLDVEDIDDDFQDVADYLSRPTMDSAFIRSLEYEEDYEKEVREKEKALIDALKEKEDARQKEEEARQREDAERQSNIKLIKRMYAKGFTIDEIAEDTGKSVGEVSIIIKNN